MVLQARKPAVIWGFAKQGALITTWFDGKSYNTTAGNNFIWRQTLPVKTASSTSYNLYFSSSSGGSTLSLLDVLFGEVFICGGQSNMQMSMSGIFNATQEIAAANYPNIRIFTVGDKTSVDPLPDFMTDVVQQWVPVTPESISSGPTDDFVVFSAICYFFARDLQAVLGKDTPIGAISDNWSGTCLQEWALPEINQACNLTYNPQRYNAMIRPYTVGPMAITGVIWSQGECNADQPSVEYYECAFPLFIQSLRVQFNNSNLFFGFELLPAYIKDGPFDPAFVPYEREAQLKGLTAGGLVAVCNAMDLGDATAPHGSVHPRNKQDVGQRLANAALALLYGQKTPYLNPAYASSTARYDGLSITVTVSFKPESLAGATLVLKPNECPPTVPPEECAWDQIQAEDGVWYNATPSISTDGTQLLLTVNTSKAMAANATRGVFSPWPVVHLYSTNGLPALPWNELVVADDPCVVTVANKTYNFHALEALTKVAPLVWIDTHSPPLFEYDFTFCSARAKFCHGDSNLCQKQLMGPGEVTLGTWNSTFVPIDNGIETTLTGATCQNSTTLTRVQLSCAHPSATTIITSVNQTGACNYLVVIQLQQSICSSLPPTTPTVSPSRTPTTFMPTISSAPSRAPSTPTTAPTYSTPCVVTVGGKSYDFTGLEARSKAQPFAWIGNATPPVYEYILAFCRARVSNCGGSNVCQLSLVSGRPENCGVWNMNWQATADGLQSQFNGSSCGTNLLRQTTVTLSCKEDYEQTSIVSVEETSHCQYSMLVQLEKQVCHSSSHAPTAPTSPPTLHPTPASVPCAFNVSGWLYNFSTLEIRTAKQPFTFNDSTSFYQLGFCSSQIRACGPRSSLCQQTLDKGSTFNLGDWSTDWTPAAGGIEAIFANGSACKGGEQRQTHVLLSCQNSTDHTFISSISEISACNFSLEVSLQSSLCPPTPAPTMAPTFTPCLVSVGGTQYDFSQLQTASSQSPLTFSDTVSNYSFTVCQARTSRCHGNTSLCQLNLTSLNERSLGLWNANWNAVDGGFQSILLGEPCGQKVYQTSVTFLCKGNFNRTAISSLRLVSPCQYAMQVQLQASVCAVPTPSQPASTNWTSVGFIIAGGVCILAAIIFLVFRRKGIAEGYRPI